MLEIANYNLKKNESLAAHTTFGVGGKAKWFCQVAAPEELVGAVNAAKKEKIKYCVIAGGSNVLFSNKPYSGLVVVYRKKEFSEKDLMIEGDKIICPASVCLDNFIELAVKKGWAGLEKLSWIPGTVGGAVFGNAGAYGRAISEIVEAVEIFDGKKRRWLSGTECCFGYRDSIFKKKSWLILRVAFKILKVEPSELAATRKKTIADRKAKFFEDIKCPGSYFKNVRVKKVSKKSLRLIDPVKIIDGKIPAGYLLETVGAKGLREGGIFVTDFHGNLILNDGTGTFAEVQKLTVKLKKLVKDRFGIALEEEVRIIK